MRKSLKGAFMALLILTICLTAFSTAVFAAEEPSTSVGVSVALEGTPPVMPEEYSIVLKADDAGYPMPEGGKDGIYTMIITGADSAALPEIKFDHVGVYTYTIYQLAGADASCTYDETVYHLKVFVTNKEDGSGIEAVSILYAENNNDKLDKVEFVNVYPVLTNLSVKKVWVDKDGKTPDSVTVALLRNGEKYDEAVLNKDNEWTYTWERILASDKWTVEEINVPDGYTVSYETKDQVVVVTNTEITAPPKTGDDSNVLLYFGLSIVGLVGLAGTITYAVWQKKKAE